ncbi:MAG: hypothetical protein K6F15_09010 [Treponema sp.]|nr:hypothetical protein [Treponema sp.]
MAEAMKQIFDDWTSYDTWLIANYAEYSIISLNEVDGKIVAEYIDKGETIPE